MDAAVLKGPRRERDAEPLFHERGQRRTAAQAENFAFDPVVLRDAVVSAGGVQHPVADIDHVQKLAELCRGQIYGHRSLTFLSRPL